MAKDRVDVIERRMDGDMDFVMGDLRVSGPSRCACFARNSGEKAASKRRRPQCIRGWLSQHSRF